MHLRYLHYLRLVIDHGSFSAAGRAGGVTQPAISHGLQQLQKGFDQPLFIRVGRRQQPTDTALRAAAWSRSASEQIGALVAVPVGRAPRDSLRVGLTASAALLCAPLLAATWCAGDAHRRLTLRQADEGQLLAQLQAGELDLVLSPLPRHCPASGLRRQALFQITPRVYARRGHPLARAASLEALQDAAWAIVGPSVSGPVDVLTEAHAVRRMRAPRVAVSCPDYACLLQLLAHSDLLGVLPHPVLLASAAAGQVMSLRLREALPRYQMHLFTAARPRSALAPVVAALHALGERLASGEGDTAGPLG